MGHTELKTSWNDCVVRAVLARCARRIEFQSDYPWHCSHLLYQLGTGGWILEAEPVRDVYHEPGNLEKIIHLSSHFQIGLDNTQDLMTTIKVLYP